MYSKSHIFFLLVVIIDGSYQQFCYKAPLTFKVLVSYYIALFICIAVSLLDLIEMFYYALSHRLPRLAVANCE